MHTHLEELDNIFTHIAAASLVKIRSLYTVKLQRNEYVINTDTPAATAADYRLEILTWASAPPAEFPAPSSGSPEFSTTTAADTLAALPGPGCRC